MDRYNLQRFHQAQKNSYAAALAEITAGRKRSHWIWYIFPQIAGLGHSPTAEYYAISCLDEAREYLKDPVLKNRLEEISGRLLTLESDDPEEVMGYPDDLKLKSSMTLFEAADPDCPVYPEVLEKFYGGARDGRTLELIR